MNQNCDHLGIGFGPPLVRPRCSKYQKSSCEMGKLPKMTQRKMGKGGGLCVHVGMEFKRHGRHLISGGRPLLVRHPLQAISVTVTVLGIRKSVTVSECHSIR